MFFGIVFTYILDVNMYTGPKKPWSTEQASLMSEMHGTSLQSTPQPFWTYIFISGT